MKHAFNPDMGVKNHKLDVIGYNAGYMGEVDVSIHILCCYSFAGGRGRKKTIRNTYYCWLIINSDWIQPPTIAGRIGVFSTEWA